MKKSFIWMMIIVNERKMSDELTFEQIILLAKMNLYCENTTFLAGSTQVTSLKSNPP